MDMSIMAMPISAGICYSIVKKFDLGDKLHTRFNIERRSQKVLFSIVIFLIALVVAISIILLTSILFPGDNAMIEIVRNLGTGIAIGFVVPLITRRID
ncbi:MAG: hypothetical protein FWE28_01795 [Oscillospiraceae bacterium]|nr:hypothetical protein [Oscillospiraceae bacterium]